jgi:hypothetical protein
MKASSAFLISHEIYQAARELVNSRIATTQLQSASKFLWRPDLHPRLVEYVADFARAGERALGEIRAPSPKPPVRGALGVKKVRASRLILFRMYYLGGAEYHAARRTLGISEITWSDWAEEIRRRVGRELIRSGMFPPSRYFRQMSDWSSPV